MMSFSENEDIINWKGESWRNSSNTSPAGDNFHVQPAGQPRAKIIWLHENSISVLMI